jgi:hypothetical protein
MQHVHPEPSARGHHHVRQSRQDGPTRSFDGLKIFWNDGVLFRPMTGAANISFVQTTFTTRK